MEAWTSRKRLASSRGILGSTTRTRLPPLGTGGGAQPVTADVRRLGPSEWRAWRVLRLRALAGDPAAFGSTYDREAAWSDEQWRTRTIALAPFVVEEDGRLVASAGLVSDAEGVPHLVAMWVDPESARCRRRGVPRGRSPRVAFGRDPESTASSRPAEPPRLPRDPRVTEHEMELKLR